MSPIVNPSAVANPTDTKNSDQLNGPGHCGSGTPRGADGGSPIQSRCGYGPRLPLLVISPDARRNFVDHGLTDQSSILRFIEDSWGTGRIGGGSFDAIAGPITTMLDFDHPRMEKLMLDPTTGERRSDGADPRGDRQDSDLAPLPALEGFRGGAPPSGGKQDEDRARR